MDFTQHVTQPTHIRGHTLDLVITYGLSTGVSSVVDLAVSDHYCVFFNITGFIQRETSVRTVTKRHLTPEVAAKSIELLEKCPPTVLPAPCDFIMHDFNSRLKSTLNTVAPLTKKTIRNRPIPPWRNKELKELKQNCRVAERRWWKNKITTQHQIYSEKLKIYNKAIRDSRNKYFSNLISNHKHTHTHLGICLHRRKHWTVLSWLMLRLLIKFSPQ